MLRLLLALLLVLSPLVVLAQSGVDTSTRDALEREIEEYERLREQRTADISQIEQNLGATAASLQARIRDRDAISAQISDLRVERAGLQAQIAQLGEDLAATGREIERIMGELEELMDRISALLVNLYTQRSSRYAQALSRATSYHDLQVRSHYLSLLTRQDADLVNELDDVRERLLEAQSRQSDQLASLEATEEQLRVTEANLVSEEQSLAAVIAELQSTQAGQQAQQQALLQAQNEIESALAGLARNLETELRRLAEEEERLRREAAQAFIEERQRQQLLQQAEETREQIDALTAPLLPASSDFGWPVSNPAIVSRFGFDNNSYLALQAESAYAPVWAIEAGVVVNVQNLSANDGFVVVVQHAQDLLVSYTNLQQPIVSPRERVTKGQQLGNLGGGTLVDDDVLKLWVMVGSTFVDPQARLGF